MKSKAEYRRRWCEGLRLGYMVNSRDPSFPRRYAKAMMREDKRIYWAKKHRKLGPSYNRSPIDMWPTCIISVDLAHEVRP